MLTALLCALFVFASEASPHGFHRRSSHRFSRGCSGYAKYKIVNDCEWTSKTHPTDYPSNANFSPLCGTTHNAGYTLFKRGGFATKGVQDVAEEGDHDRLTSEIRYCAKKGRCQPKGYFRFACSKMSGVCEHKGTIKVSPKYPYVSMMSMIAPSPDWFVGRSNINLCEWDKKKKRYSWAKSYGPVGLLAYDAGTDKGKTFKSKNKPNFKREQITVFDAKDKSNIFYNRKKRALLPLCKLYLKRVF